MTDETREFEISVEREKGYQFRVDFGLENVKDLLVDEDPPLGEGLGPDSSRLLAAAVSQCMMSSLLFCLQKSRAETQGMKANTRMSFKRNQEGRLRIRGIDISIEISVEEESKFERCQSIFENFCTVTQSIKNGIPVKARLIRK